VREEALVLGEVGHEDTDSAANHSVLSHKDDTTTTESFTDLVHLLGGDLIRARYSQPHHSGGNRAT
jgi:hypothetical protein